MVDLASNPFFWHGFVFCLFGLLLGVSVGTLGALPKHILDAL